MINSWIIFVQESGRVIFTLSLYGVKWFDREVIIFNEVNCHYNWYVIFITWYGEQDINSGMMDCVNN